MPKLWSETVDAHRREVRDAILDTTAALAAEHGLLSVTMSQIAERTGIGRATLYKYFPDVQAILLAWHDRQVGEHLADLAEARDRTSGARERLAAVLGAYAQTQRHRAHRHQQEPELAVFLHHDQHLAQPRQQLHALVRELVADAVADGAIRDDVPPDELTTYCLHALAAAGDLPSQAALRRLVTITLDGLRPS